MPDLPLITVLLTVHNEARFLKIALESILAQTFQKFELLILDDASTDLYTLELLSNLTDQRVRVIRNDKNLGLTGSLIKGLGFAQGEFIARMDADDVADVHRLEKQCHFLLSHPEVGIVGSAAILIDEDGKKVGLQQVSESDLEIRWKILFKNPFIHSSVMIRKNILVEHCITYDANFQVAQDYDLWRRLLVFTTAANLAEPLVYYRIQRKSISTQRSDAQFSAHLQIAERTLDELHLSATISKELFQELDRRISDRPVNQRGHGNSEILRAYLLIWKKFCLQGQGAPDVSYLQKKVAIRGIQLGLWPLNFIENFRSIITLSKSFPKWPLWLLSSAFANGKAFVELARVRIIRNGVR